MDKKDKYFAEMEKVFDKIDEVSHESPIEKIIKKTEEIADKIKEVNKKYLDM